MAVSVQTKTKESLEIKWMLCGKIMECNVEEGGKRNEL